MRYLAVGGDELLATAKAFRTVTRNSSGDEITESDIINYLYLLPLLRLTPLAAGFPCDDLRKILHVGQRMAKVSKMAKRYYRKFRPPE